MLFNSIDFAIYLPIIFGLYWFVFHKKIQHQNLLIVVASYVFYGWWDWRFLSLIAFSTLVDYTLGIKMHQEKKQKKRKLYLWASILINLGFLGFFKYYNFFLDNFVNAFSLMGTKINPWSLKIILPVGISFYTFQTLSYTIDVYKQKLEPTKNLIAFTAFVSFFPQLVAGPIERASNLLPQFFKPRTFNYGNAIIGLRQILWGLFMKVVIADGCAEYANLIFSDYQEYGGLSLFLGALFFTFQIYGDFAGYSNIAIGTSRLFGFSLMQNFAFPYFSRDIAEFWRRWHISLSTWFRDYLYIPLGGSKGGIWKKVRNTFVIFIVSGFWHGANWTFIAWGFLNALYFLPLLLLKRNRKNTNEISEGKIIPSFREIISIGITFTLTVIAWIFFRSESIQDAYLYIKYLVAGLKSKWTYLEALELLRWKVDLHLIILLIAFIGVEWLNRNQEFGFQKIEHLPRWMRWSIYYALLISIVLFASSEQEFIYFQF